MKRFVMSFLVLLMLALMVVPIRVFADDTTATSTMTPYDWLNQDEQAYVTALRGNISSIQDNVRLARIDLASMNLQDLKTWYDGLAQEFDSINSTEDIMDALTASPEFTSIADRCKNMPGPSSFELDIAGYMRFSGALVETVQMISHLDDDLAAIDDAANSLAGAINARIADVAKRREAANKMIGNIFDSCSQRPAPILVR